VALPKLIRPRTATAKRPPLPPGAERRKFERFELLAQVELRRHGEVYLLPVVNISAGGMLVRIDDGSLTDIAVDERVNVYLEVADFAEPLTMTMEAVVVRVGMVDDAPVGVALMWTSVNGSALVQLAKLLDYVRTRDTE